MTDQTSVTYSLPVVEWEQVKACENCKWWLANHECDRLVLTPETHHLTLADTDGYIICTDPGFSCCYFQPKDDL